MTSQSAVPPRSKVRRSPMEHPRHQYPQETKALQEIAQACGLVEKIKWGKPCFMHDGRNIVLIQRFKSYIALMFFNGALLKDPEKRLFRISDNMDMPRQLRFRHVEEIRDSAPTIAAYIREATALEYSGVKAKARSAKQLEVPVELEVRLKGDQALNTAFASLTPGRKKGYIFYIAGAKQSSTRQARIEKNIPRILAGKGLRD